MPKIAVFLAEGFEEVEAVTPIDYLRRAGVDVIIAGVGSVEPRGARGIVVRADVMVENLPRRLDGVVLPGGMPGAEHLAQSAAVRNLCRATMDTNGLVAAICASPAVALGPFGILEGRRFTCYPGFEDRVAGGEFRDDRVVEDGNVITSRGAGTAGDFSIALIRRLVGAESAERIAAGVLL